MNLFDDNRRFNLVLCELHYTPIHGKTNISNENIESHYLLMYKFDGLTGQIIDDDLEAVSDSDANSDDSMYISEIQEITANFYNETRRIHRNKPHKTIRNYHNIISLPNYIKPEIGKCLELPTGEQIVIIKTSWIKIIQRTWKKIYAVRQYIINCRSNPTSLYVRQLTGTWPIQCRHLPELKGMLSTLC